MARKLPALTPDNSAFWQGGAEGTLNMHHCQGCQRYFHPPAPICPRCLSQDVGPRPVSGRGKVLSYTVNHQRWNTDVEVPYVVAIVELADQPDLRLVSNIVGMPVIARLHATKDRARLQRFLGLTAAGMTLGVAVLALPFLLQGKWVLATVFGAEFADGNAILLALCGSAFIYAAFGIVAALLNMTGYQKQVTRASIVALLCLMVLAYPMIHFFGVMGAAISDVASTLVWNLIMWVAARKQLKLDTSLLALSSRGKARTGHGVR